MLNDLGPFTNWIIIFGLVALAIILYIYEHGKSIHDEYDKKYQLMGTRGGKAEKSEEIDEDITEEDELMEFEKQEEKTYKNDYEKLN